MSFLSFLAPVVGGLLGSRGSRGGGTQTTQQQIAPELQPLLGAVGQRGQDMLNLPFQGLPFNPVAGFTDSQYQGMDSIMGQAQNPWLLNQAQSGLSNMMGGAAWGPQAQAGTNPLAQSNQYVDAIANKTMDDVQGRMNAGAFGSGSFGNANVARQASEGLANASNQLRFQDFTNRQGLMENQANRNQQTSQFNSNLYNQGFQNQMGALGMAPSMYQAGFMPGQQMMNIGGLQQQQGQNFLNAAQQEFMRAQDHPFRQWQAALGAFGGNTGGTTTQQQPRGNSAAGFLGGALAGGQLGNLFGGFGQNTNGVF
jgi:hypothetical protein